MLSSYISGRVGVFIDEANLFHSQRTLGWRIDYQKLYWMLYDLELGAKKIFVYTNYLKLDSKKLSFINKLIDYGYVIHSKEVKEINTGAGIIRKGNLDVELAIDAYKFQNIYDTAVIFSGDSDFAYLLELLKENGKRIVIISTRRHVSFELIHRADTYVDLRRMRKLLEKTSDDNHKAASRAALEVLPNKHSNSVKHVKTI